MEIKKLTTKNYNGENIVNNEPVWEEKPLNDIKDKKENLEERLSCDSCDFIGDRNTMLDHVIGTTHKIVEHIEEESWEKDYKLWLCDVSEGERSVDEIEYWFHQTIKAEREKGYQEGKKDWKRIGESREKQAKDSFIMEIEEYIKNYKYKWNDIIIREDMLNYLKTLK